MSLLSLRRDSQPPRPEAAVEVHQFQTLPGSADELPADLNMPTLTFNQTERIGNALVRSTLEVPEEVLDPVPLVLVHGYHGTEGAYSVLRNWCARNGKPALTMQPTRELAHYAGYHPAHFFHPERLLSQTVVGAMRATLKNARAEKRGVDGSRADLDGHSMGTRTSLDATEFIETQSKDKRLSVRSLTLTAGAGLEPHSLADFVFDRIPRFVAGELREACRRGDLVQPELILEQLAYIAGGKLRAAKEGISIGGCDARPRLEKVTGLGVPTRIKGFKADALTPVERIISYSGHLVNAVAVIPYTSVGHLGPQTHPEAVGQAQFELLDSMNGTNLALRRKKPEPEPELKAA